MKQFMALFVLLTSFMLAACGSPAAIVDPTGVPPEPTAEPTVAAEPTAAEAMAGALTFTNDLGTFTLDAPAEKIVVLSEESLDFLITLGVQPVGFGTGRTSTGTVGTSYDEPHFFPAELIGTPTFVGTESEPSLELISSLAPDLIISATWGNVANAQLAQIAPTYLIDTAAEGYWRDTLIEIGALLGKSAEAEQFIADYDATSARLAEELAPLAASKPDVLFVYSYAAADGTMLLGPGWSGSKPFELLGFNVLSPEGYDFDSAGGAMPISPEVVGDFPADIIFVIRTGDLSGPMPEYPVDALLRSVPDVDLIYQFIPTTRGSTAPYTDRFVLEQIASLLVEGSK